MRKIFSLLITVLLTIGISIVPVSAQSSNLIKIDKNNISNEVSSQLYGLNLNNTSFSLDGGLVSNLVSNNSFENSQDGLASWKNSGLDIQISSELPLNSSNKNYISVYCKSKGELTNLGFTEFYKDKTAKESKKIHKTADMGFKENEKYEFSCYIKNIDFEGDFFVGLNSKHNSDKTKIDISSYKSNWNKIEAVLISNATEDGGLTFEFNGKGTILIDFVSLVPQSSYGYGMGNWKYTSLRNDLYTALSELSPKFIRFSTDFSSSENNTGKLHSWKNTIGKTEERVQTSSFNNSENTVSVNSNAMGCHEFFQLCSELSAEPIPVINTGVMCQNDDEDDEYNKNLKEYKDGKMSDGKWNEYINSVSHTPDTPEFNNYIQDIFDLIEYANGDATKNYWGALRASNGHSEPFNLKYIELSNCDYTEMNIRNFEAINKAIKQKYPDIQIIASTGNSVTDKDYDNVVSSLSDFDGIIRSENIFADENFFYESDKNYNPSNPVIVGRYGIVSDKDNLQYNLQKAVAEASLIVNSFEKNSNVMMTAHESSFSKLNAQSDNSSLVWFNSNDILLTPGYYVQIMFANNTGNKTITSDFKLKEEKSNKGISQSITIDENTQTIYVKLINSTGKNQKVTVDASDFSQINKVSSIKLENKFKTASNDFGKSCIVPTEQEISQKDGIFEVDMLGYSVSVIRIAYNDNNGKNFYSLPDFIPETKNYVPLSVKIFIPSISVVAIAVVGSIIFFSKKNKKHTKKSKNKNNTMI